MTTSMLFVLGLGLTLIMALAIVTYLRPQLHKMLVELCGTQERAAFWVSFTNVTITLVPLIFAMQCIPALKAGTPPVFELATQLKWALAGLLTAVLILGWILSRFIRRGAVPTIANKPSPVSAD